MFNNIWTRRLFYLVFFYFILSSLPQLISMINERLQSTDAMVEKLPSTKDVSKSKLSTTKEPINKKMKPEKNMSNSGHVVLYNRISKAGSTTMKELISRLAIKNKFMVSETIDIQGLIKNYSTNMKNAIHIQHFPYKPLPKWLEKHVSYINVMRDPIQRFISYYNYHRFHMFQKYIPEVKKGDIMKVSNDMFVGIKNSWLKQHIRTCGYRGLRDRATGQECWGPSKYIELDVSVVNRVRNMAHNWLQKSINDCLHNTNDKECHDYSRNRRTQVNFRRILLLHHAGTKNTWFTNPSFIYPPYFVDPSSARFFCEDSFCLDSINKQASAKSIHTIKTGYEVVGILEDMEMTLRVLEHKLPRFFKGAFEEFEAMKEEGRDEANSLKHEKPSLADLSKLKKGFEPEYEIYNYAYERLKKQYNSIGTDN